MSDAQPKDPAAEGVEEGKRLIRLSDDKGLGLADRFMHHFTRLTWNTPLHKFHLRGQYPLKLSVVPQDPIPGNPASGQAIRAGHFLFRGLKQPIRTLDFHALDVTPPFADYIHSFAWLRDLASVAPRVDAAPIAENVLRKWVTVHADDIAEPAWRSDLTGWRILYWTAYAPLLLSHNDIVLRSSVLNGIARMARHLDRTAERVRPGVPQLIAWIGVVAASLILPGGEGRRIFGESGLKKSLETTFYVDGGNISRSPAAQMDAIMALSMLERCYEARKETPPAFLSEIMAHAVPALLGLTHGDGGLGNWQGSAATDASVVEAIVNASKVRARPLKQARDWGYQRLIGGGTVYPSTLIVDAAPPPIAKVTNAGCASTLAIEFSSGPNRIFVNCGGAALAGATIPQALAQGLRTSAAHSTLVLADSNSTAILPDGTLGKGVTEVELDRRENEQGSRLEVSHDGYAKRHGFLHRRLLILAPGGQELRGEDMLLPIGKKKRADSTGFSVRFHLGHTVEPSLTADNQGALLRLPDGGAWQFRCTGGELAIEDSIWVDGDGRPHNSRQLVISGQSPAGGCSIGWITKKIS